MLWTYLSRAIFKLCHGNHLVYNTCWEDPRLDREALELGEGDRLLVITSAGCNALDYALEGPERIDAVDMNPRQNALLDLKIAGIRNLEHCEFFELFGRGRSLDWENIYERLRNDLPEPSKRYWDRNGKFFLGGRRRPSFYFRGSAGFFAWSINAYINRWAKIRPDIENLLAAQSIEEQSAIYYDRVKPAFWGPWIKWFLRRDTTLSLLGVPQAQRIRLERQYPGGIVKFIEDCLDTVFTRLPLRDNYFWRVYLTGEYTPDCCPNYLKPECFEQLKSGLVDRVHTHTATLLERLKDSGRHYSHFVLLDHMDWMAEHLKDLLATQWQAIVDQADDEACILWRSAAVECEFVDPIEVTLEGERRPLGELLDYDRDLAARLHQIDRVHTYGGFSIAKLRLTPKSIRNQFIDSNPAIANRTTDDRVEPTKNPVSSDALAHSR